MVHFGSLESTQVAKIRFALGSYASFVLSKLPACSITRCTLAKHKPIVKYAAMLVSKVRIFLQIYITCVVEFESGTADVFADFWRKGFVEWHVPVSTRFTATSGLWTEWPRLREDKVPVSLRSINCPQAVNSLNKVLPEMCKRQAFIAKLLCSKSVLLVFPPCSMPGLKINW